MHRNDSNNYYDGYSLDLLCNDLHQNKKGSEAEGIVVKFLESNVRVKVKLEDYIRLHKILFQLSSKAIWEACAVGQSLIDELKNDLGLPKDLISWVIQEENLLKEAYNKAKNEIETIFNSVDKTLSRKEIADVFVKTEHSSALFSMLDNFDQNSIDSIIWKKLKPKTKFFKKDLLT